MIFVAQVRDAIIRGHHLESFMNAELLLIIEYQISRNVLFFKADLDDYFQ